MRCTPLDEEGRVESSFSTVAQPTIRNAPWRPFLSLRPLVCLEPLLTPLHVHVSHVSTRVNPHTHVAQPGFLQVFTSIGWNRWRTTSYRQWVVCLNLTGDRIMVVKLRLFLSSITLEFLSPEHCRYCKVWDNRRSRLRPTMPYCDTEEGCQRLVDKMVGIFRLGKKFLENY